MMRRIVAIGALLGFVAGCASANEADQWPARYHKAGVTPQQLNEDGAACLGTSPYPRTGSGTAVGIGGFGSLTPKVGESRVVEIDPFAECMKAKGYTVTQ
jgi:hypothetical protein